MPVYEFRCDACAADFEDLVPSGTARIPCPRCGSDQVHRLMSACGFSVGGKTTVAGGSSCGSCSGGSCSGCGSHGH